MTGSFARFRALAAPLFVGLVAMAVTACAPPPPPYVGIIFNTPAYSFLNRTYVPKATATTGLPVTLSLDASSTACLFLDGTLYFQSVGNCVINANQEGDATHPALKQVQRTIKVYECPALRSGVWSGPNGLTADVLVTSPTSFTGTINLSSYGLGIQSFNGQVNCEVVSMTFNGVALVGKLAYDGKTLYSSYQGIAITLYAPAG
ncbi:MAG: hypothetical protein ACKOYM_06055 [Actinomycetes bacterium]